MCIYLGDLPELNYDSAEHIIPAGLGGIKKLPADYVSREFNNRSSRYETALMRSSILALPRQLLGPGKRGSLNIKKATKSSVGILAHFPENGSYSLGYIVLGKPYEIPHLVLNIGTGEFSLNMHKGATDEEFQVFRKCLSEFELLKTKFIAFPELPAHTFLIGIKKGIEANHECFIASPDGNTHPFNKEILTELAGRVNNISELSGTDQYHVRVHQTAHIGDEYYKCCAKIAFNFLAHVKGSAFVQRECFDPLRNWIVNEGENDYVELSPKHVSQPIFPKDSHQILITKTENRLLADVCFYNHFHNSVLLSENFTEIFPMNGFICDWQNKKEYGFYEFLKTLASQQSFS